MAVSLLLTLIRKLSKVHHQTLSLGGVFGVLRPLRGFPSLTGLLSEDLSL